MNISPIAEEFSDFYSTQSLGRVPLDTGDFIPAGYGGIAFLDDDTLLIGGSPYTSDAAIYSVDVTRDPDTNSITGFAAPATFLANAPGSADPDTVIGGLDGLIVAPNGTLLYTSYEDNTIGQILPGNTEPDPDAFIDLTALGVEPSTGALRIVPEGFPGEGRLKLTSFDADIFYDALLTPNEDGTYSVSVEEESVTFDSAGSRGIDAFVYLDESYPGVTSDSVLISQYFAQDISVFEVDDIGNPILETERVFLDDFAASGGFLFGNIIDPVTGDILVSLDSGFTVNATETGGTLLLITDEAPPTAEADNNPFDDATELDISSGEATTSGAVSTGNDVYTINASAGELLSVDINVTERLPGIAYTSDDTQLYLYNEAGDVLAFSDDKTTDFSSR
ncbi:MAG: PEP-CTERM sorting domain-containing protein, partial [Cyanobacteria bacterium P01_F01_bin.143]